MRDICPTLIIHVGLHSGVDLGFGPWVHALRSPLKRINNPRALVKTSILIYNPRIFFDKLLDCLTFVIWDIGLLLKIPSLTLATKVCRH